MTKVTGHHVTSNASRTTRVLCWFENFPNHQLIHTLWPSKSLLGSSTTHQQRTSSLVPWKPQDSFINLLPNTESNDRLHPTFGPSTKTRAQPKTVHTLGVHQSLQTVHNDWWSEIVSRTIGNPFDKLHKIQT